MYIPETTTAHLHDGRYVEVPKDLVRDWQYQAHNLDTTLGLADWYVNDEENEAEILGEADDDTRCAHDERSHRVTNESQTGEYVPDKPMRSVRVCNRRACLLDAMAWVERGTGEPAAWQAPGHGFRFDVPRDITAQLL